MQGSNIGFALYAPGEAPGTLDARWSYENASSGSGQATGGPREGFAGRYWPASVSPRSVLAPARPEEERSSRDRWERDEQRPREREVASDENSEVDDSERHGQREQEDARRARPFPP